jgi:uncharacterized repeat protein (TIGR01451 family)
MFSSLRRTLAFAILAVAVFAPALAHADGDVHVALTAQRVTVADGKDVYASAEKARPGDVIEYRAVYKNDGRTAVRELDATLPVPNGLEYLPKTAAPAVVLASTDGQSFAPVPLVRKTRTADGREEIREVPLSEYRALRWSIGALAAKESRTVRARMRVAPLASVASNTH